MKMMRVAMIGVAAGALALAGCKNEQKASTESGPAGAATVKSANYVNKRCPISGAEISGEATTVSYKGKGVGFCCPNCIGQWNGMSDAQKSEKIAAASK